MSESQSQSHKERSMYCTTATMIISGIFWTYFTFASPDDNNKCYGRQVYSPMTDDVVT